MAYGISLHPIELVLIYSLVKTSKHVCMSLRIKKAANVNVSANVSG